MLKTLYIKNYALIDSLEITFEPGFSVITGETGAGKSIILGALSLILGHRADMKAIKSGESKCVIEGTFDVSSYDLKFFCEEHDLEYDSTAYILRREILSTGKSRAFINDSPVSLNDLKVLGERLIDIHSQHKNLLLGDNHFQMQVVDMLSDSKNILGDYQKSYREYCVAQKELDELTELSEKSREDEDYLRFQYNTLSEAALLDGEQEVLEQEQEMLNHAEDIKSALFRIYTSLSDDENGVVIRLKDSLNAAQGLSQVYSKSEDIIKRLESAYIDLKDLSPEIERYAEDVEFNPERLDFITARLDLIYTLQQKYKTSSVAELIALQHEFEEKLNNIDSFDLRIDELQKEVDAKHKEMLSNAGKLSEKRRASTFKIEGQLVEKIAVLGMPYARFVCEITDKVTPDLTGMDNLRFMFSANKNIPLQPISEVASGGEISRVMLCLKAMIAGATDLPTIIFDEIDTGVSGEVADKMGQIMHEIGGQMQVIAITHLPQVAARGKEHYFVYKISDEDSTKTNIRKLSETERVKEIAQMLSGVEISDAAIENAKVMLNKQ